MSEKLEVTEEQYGQIFQLIGSMPYGANLPVKRFEDSIGEYLVIYLGRLQERLNTISVLHKKDDDELRELREAMAGLRKFLIVFDKGFLNKGFGE